MRPQLFTLLLASSLALPATHTLIAQTPATSIDTRLATQNALFEELYQADLKNAPERATAYGDYRYNDQLSDRSLAAIDRRHTADVANLARLKAISTTGFPEQDILSHDLLTRVIQQRIDDYDLKEYEMPVDQMNGVHTGLADLPLAMPFDSVKHYEDYIARLHQIPRVLNQTTEVLRAGMKDNLMPVRFLLEKVPGQCNGIIEADPFLIPTKKYPASISPEDQKRLTAEITAAVNNDVIPAYRTFAAFITTDYAPHGRTTLAVTSLPDGAKRYQNDIVGPHHHAPHARTDPHPRPQRGRPHHRRDDHPRPQGWLQRPRLLPRVHQQQIPSGPPPPPSRSSTTTAATSRRCSPSSRSSSPSSPAAPSPSKPSPSSSPPTPPTIKPARPTANAPAASASPPATTPTAPSSSTRPSPTTKASPAITCSSPSSSSSRACPNSASTPASAAYSEGWALYAEQLGKEVGFYQDPVSDYGRLNSELFRAVRLVVDTGIHSMGWTRDQVVDYMRKNDVNEPLIQSETDRYIAWPAQACSYKLGQLKIIELRERAKKELGPKFDIRTFHDEILSGGGLPLDMLDARTTQWIAVQKSKPTQIVSVGVPVQP